MEKRHRIIKGRVKVIPFYLFTLLLLISSCSETDSDQVEYPDWQNKNEAYFEQQYQAHSASNIFAKWSMGEGVTAAHTDCILVDRIEEGMGGNSPYYNDSVVIHYSGHLLPSTSYPSGMVFDKSYLKSTPDQAVDAPARIAVSSTTGTVAYYRMPTCSDFVPGFSTALQHMHRGDHWRVTIPHQLAYGASANGSIPAYSTLIFDIWLVDFWTKHQGDRE